MSAGFGAAVVARIRTAAVQCISAMLPGRWLAWDEFFYGPADRLWAETSRPNVAKTSPVDGETAAGRRRGPATGERPAPDYVSWSGAGHPAPRMGEIGPNPRRIEVIPETPPVRRPAPAPVPAPATPPPQREPEKVPA